MRPYREGDEQDIRDLFELVFDKPLSLERWLWQYRDNGTDTFIITLAEGEGGELAGQYALRPTRMKIGDKTRLGTLSLDTMVHPDYRRQGMFTKTAKHAYQTAKQLEVPLTYGFPNQNSYHGFVHRLEWVDLCGRLPVFVRILKLENVLSKRIDSKLVRSVVKFLGDISLGLFYRFRRGGDLPPGHKLTEVSSLDERVDRLWEEAAADHEILVVRDQSYLNWRFVENPTESYTIFICEQGQEVAGYVVLKCEEKFGLRIGFIVDILVRPGARDVSTGLVSEAVKYFQENQMDLVSCLVLEHTVQAESLKRNGFVVVPQGFFPQELYLGVRSHTDEYAEEFIMNSENWFITWADHDTI
jgi:GNAT superfamily N-acetyltransferase/ribosomal protein S18 acetylase RimI-like enzyme